MGCGASSTATATARTISKSIREQPTVKESVKAESNTGMFWPFIAFFFDDGAASWYSGPLSNF